MKENRLAFLKSAFPKHQIKFSEDCSNATIVNPNYDESITVYDEGHEYIACFSFQHRHLDDAESVVAWSRDIMTGQLFAIEFFREGRRCFGSEIEAGELEELTYEKLEQFTGQFGLTKLFFVADTCKVRGWDSQQNFDASFVRESNGCGTIKKM